MLFPLWALEKPFLFYCLFIALTKNLLLFALAATWKMETLIYKWNTRGVFCCVFLLEI